MSRTLYEQHCQPCIIGTRAMLPEDSNRMLASIPRWKKVSVDGMEQIRREFHFRDFKEAAAFAHKIGLLAERENHHPHAAGGMGQDDGVLVDPQSQRPAPERFRDGREMRPDCQQRSAVT